MSKVNDFCCCSLIEPIRFDERLILQTPDGTVCALNETGTWLWLQLARGDSLLEAVSALAEMFDHPVGEVEAEARGLVRQWENLRLIETMPVEVMPAELRQEPPLFEAVYQLGEQAVRIRCYLPKLAQKLRSALAPSRIACADSSLDTLDLYEDDDGFAVARNHRVVFQTEDAGYAWGAMVQQVLELSWPTRSWLACLHGAAVGNGQSCLLLSGDCGAGKTILTAALVDAGYAFMADDMIPIEGGSHDIWPLAISMSLKESGIHVVKNYFPEVEDLESEMTDRGRLRYFFPTHRRHPAHAGGLPAQALIFPRYQEGAPLAFAPVAPFEALQRLSGNGSSLDLCGCHLRETLGWLATLPCYGLTYGDTAEAVATLTDFWDAA